MAAAFKRPGLEEGCSRPRPELARDYDFVEESGMSHVHRGAAAGAVKTVPGHIGQQFAAELLQLPHAPSQFGN